MLKLALGLIALNIFSSFNNVNPIFHIDVDDSVDQDYVLSLFPSSNVVCID